MTVNKIRIKELEKIIIALDTSFDVGNDCINPISEEIVLDNEYDSLKKELLTLCPESKIFKTVTSSISKISGKKIKHSPPMTSINKCNGTEEEKKEILKKFFNDYRKKFKIDEDVDSLIEDGKTFCMSYKIDGLAASINYQNGKLVSGATRGDGILGVNITDKTKYIKGIPQTLPLPLTLKIRGEIFTPISVFNRINENSEKNFSNARAYSTGQIGHKTIEKIKDSGLSFIAYSILKLENPPYSTEIERNIWARKLGINFVETVPFSYKILEKLEEEYKSKDIMIDGVVVSINNLKLQKEMGHSGDKDTGNPKGKCAWKFRDEIKTAVVREVEWRTGRSSIITPVLIITPIQLEGTQIQKVTAHNLSIIKNEKIGKNSIVEIVKSGKIIPKLHKVVEAKGKLNIPTNCPSCGFPTEIRDGNNNSQSLICTNKDNCPAQNIKNLDHWLKTLGVIGIAGSTIKKLIDVGLIQKPGDFYRLTVDGLISNGFTERTAVLIVARIWMVQSPEQIKNNSILVSSIIDHSSQKIKIPMEKFFAAFGIKNSGKTIGAILAKKIGNWEKIKKIKLNELENIDGIGHIIAKEIVEFFERNIKMVEDAEKNFEFETKQSGGKLEGKKFVLSGKLESKNGEGKAYFKNLIEKNAGEVKGSVGKTIDFVICGAGSGLKSKKAESLNIPILTGDDLEEMLN